MKALEQEFLTLFSSPWAALGWTAYFAITATFLYRMVRSRGKLSITSHRVVLVGPARVGKTSSIVAALDQVRRGRVYGGLARLRSEATISKISRLAAVLNAGDFPAPTKEDETSVYRFDYAAKVPQYARIILSMVGINTLYRVEVADFAGEQSEKYFLEHQSILPDEFPDDYGINASHNFLKWISESDVCVVFIDCDQLSRMGEAYVQQVTDQYVTFWSFYLDVHADNIFSAKAPPVVVAYTKVDVLVSSRDENQNVSEIKIGLDRTFRDLLDFLRQNSGSVRSVATSVVLRSHEERVGINRLVHLILPRRGKI